MSAIERFTNRRRTRRLARRARLTPGQWLPCILGGFTGALRWHEGRIEVQFLVGDSVVSGSAVMA
ncbi:hypothetical protein GCM10027515_26690 [Schumannella luteola]|uniref:Uncharacterized protein n=1 Tax=Schumannella luteola TaxID=472059 RepID=A0A852YE06_9MICO|nr:hypothetical protein [Schumannella luteola]NYG99534.1 hypothetical protein [Schumannella luteola]